MAITAAVTPGETYPDSTNVTRAMLRNGAAPTVAISGDIENADVAAAAAIEFSKLEPLANGSVIVGNASSVATECHYSCQTGLWFIQCSEGSHANYKRSQWGFTFNGRRLRFGQLKIHNPWKHIEFWNI